MLKIGVAALAACVLLAGCAQRTVFVRIDGRPAAADPVLAQQFEVDRAICAGAREQANLSGVTFTGGGMAGIAAGIQRDQSANTVANGCMAQKGYLSVPEEHAAQKSAELAAVDAERRRQEAAAAAPPAPAPSPRRAKPAARPVAAGPVAPAPGT